MKNTRVAFVLVSIATLALLVGSAILQRIVFKAAESSSTVYLSPTNFLVKPGGKVNLSVVSNFSIPAYVASAQFVISYDETQLSFEQGVASSGFETKKLKTQAGKLFWALTPNTKGGVVGQYDQSTTFGQLYFLAKQAASVTISVDPELTVISAIDPTGQSALYNAVASVQNSVGEITALATTNVVGQDSGEFIERSFTNFLAQRAIKDTVIPLVNSAISIVRLKDIGKIEINFGLTESLGGVVVSTVADSSFVTTLSGLQSNSRYYYRLKVLSEGGSPLVIYPLKTFTTVATSKKAVDPGKSELETVELGNNQARVIAIQRDSIGNITTQPVSFAVISGEVALTPASLGALSTVGVESLINSKQSVEIEAKSANEVIGSTQFTLEPTTQSAATGQSAAGQTLPLNRQTLVILGALLIIILSSGLVLARLHRVH
ncbi:MAG: hypothetical protein WD970_00120 [Patescibacteria group bacterium]